MDKKGFLFLGRHVVNIVITVLVIVILAFLMYKGILLWNNGNKLEQAGETLEEVAQKVNLVNKENIEGKIIIFPPKGWYLRGFSNYDFPIGECFQAKDCLCICKDIRCEGSKKCDGFSFDVEVDGEIIKSAGGNVAGVAIARDEGLKLDSNEELVIIKEEYVKIKRSEDGF
jgi:hypothetical protein